MSNEEKKEWINTTREQVEDTTGRERRLKELRVEIKAHIKSTPGLEGLFDEMSALLESARKKARCHDCGVSEGEIHEYGCDMEVCPFCGGQLISCDCGIGEMDDEPFSKIYDEDIDEIGTHLGISREEVV